MREEAFEQISIICPECRKPELQSPLKLDSIFKKDEDFVQTGFLSCSNPSCEKKFPVLAGVPIVLKDIDKWMRSDSLQLSTFLEKTPEIRNFYDLKNQPVEVNEGALSAYMDSHYPVSSLDEFWKKAIELIDSNHYEFALDIGCSVGRYTFELARCSQLAVGIDLNFIALAAAERTQRTQTATYKRRIRGEYYQSIHEPYLAPANALFLVADALNPPFKAYSFDVVSGLNILDNVAVPLILIGQMDALLKVDGDLILSSPYDWHTDISKVDEWLENEVMTAPEMLQKILEDDYIPKMELKYKILQQQFDVPWILRNYDRHWSMYLVHLLKARKYAGSSV